MVQGWAAASTSHPQAYSVACPGGHRLSGHRTEGYQALRCPTCGEGVFVLPRSPLPVPPVPASAESRARVAAEVEAAYPDDDPLVLTDPPASASTSALAPTEADVDARGHKPESEAEGEIDWVDELPTEPEARPVVAREGPGPSPRQKPVDPRPKPASRPTPRPEVRKPRDLAAEVRGAREWAWAHRNALLIASAVLLMIGAVVLKFRRQRFEELPRVAELGRTEGLKKLDAGEFFAARKILGDASDAVDALGGRFEGAGEIRQAALEAALLADRAPEGLAELVEEAAKAEKEWPSRFATMYKGRSVIVDAPVSAVPDPAKPDSAYEVDYPIFFGKGPKPQGKGRIALVGFRLFEKEKPRVGDQEPFGARLASVELDVDSNEWVVTFEPGSGAYITHTKALESIEWPRPLADEERAP